MEFNKEFEEHLISAIKEAVNDSAPDLLSDMVHDNPDWWANELVSVFESTIKKALKEEKLVKEIIEKIMTEYIDELDVTQLAEEIIETKIKDTILDKITVEVKK